MAPARIGPRQWPFASRLSPESPPRGRCEARCEQGSRETAPCEEVDLDALEPRLARLDVDTPEPRVPLGARQIAPDRSGDGGHDVARRRAAPLPLDGPRDVEIQPMQEVTEGVQHALVHPDAQR